MERAGYLLMVAGIALSPGFVHYYDAKEAKLQVEHAKVAGFVDGYDKGWDDGHDRGYSEGYRTPRITDL